MDTKQFNDILLNVPGSFKAKLDRIRRYLYLEKASVMVGAGFSRNADVPSNVKVKQWNDVGEDIYCRLQAVDDVDPSKLVFKTPMRLASQFAAAFGQSELDNLIRDSIPDDRMNPGALHRQLLCLPWRDVFTTNYDTLLERTCKGLQRNYSVVTSKGMLLYKKSPRIIKLHGSFPDKTPFLMTEEHFRTYPADHPEFVNTVRQALVESIFCLIGFSGDDPNFTSWQGWLRDVMGDYAGPSYLITCDKEYDESFKTLMEHRGIQVLNFSEIKGLDNHQIALDFFFTYLSERESKWSGSVDYDSRKADAKDLTQRFKQIRQTYPGWFILPKKYYKDFTDMSYHFPYLEFSFKKFEEKDKEPLLYELDWRAKISLSFEDFDWYRKALEEVIRGYGDTPLSSEAITLGIALLRLYRHHPDKKTEAEELKKRLLKERSRMSQSQVSGFYYVVACNALSFLDYDTVETTLNEWDLTNSDYPGIIYKSLVLAETHDRAMASELLNDALDRITQSLTQTATPEDHSLRHVIENLIAFYAGERMPNKDPRFSLVDISQFIQLQANKKAKESIQISHSFSVGSSHRSWNLGSGTNTDLLHPYRLLLLYEQYGFPYGMASNTVDEKLFALYLPTLTNFGIWYSLGPVLRSGSREVTSAYMNRKTLNTLSRKDADNLANHFLAVSKQKSCEKAREYRAVNVLLPLLSRLSTSCSTTVVVEIYKFAKNYYRKTYFSKPEDLNIIYSGVLPEGIPTVCEEAFTTEIFRDVRDHDMPLPYLGLPFYSPGDKELDIIADGFASIEKVVRESAYFRTKALLRSQIEVDKKNLLFEQVREWRAKEGFNTSSRESYLFIPPTDDEKKAIHKRIKTDLDFFLKQEFKYDRSSVILSSLESSLTDIVCDVEFMTKPQISSILDKVADVLDANITLYSIDDSDELMGGLRHFTKRVFSLVGEIVRLAFKKGFDGVASSLKLYKVLEKYLPTHLPVRITMARLNQIARVIGANKMREIIAGQLFSDNEDDVIDSCNGIIFYVHNYNNYQKVLQRIIFYCNYVESELMRLYLQTLAQIPLDKMSGNTQEYLAEMMQLLMERISNKNLSEEQKVDIMHDGVYLAASLKDAPSDSPVAKALMVWEEYANNEGIYNDVRLPWFLK